MLTHVRATRAPRHAPPALPLQPPEPGAGLLTAWARSRMRTTYLCSAAPAQI